MTCTRKITPIGRRESTNMKIGDSSDEKDIYGRTIVGILRGFEPSGKTIKEYCRDKDVSEGTFYKWRSRFGTMEASEVKEYRQLQ